MLGCNLRKPRSFPENECLTTMHEAHKTIMDGFQMKIAYTIHFVKIELEGWDFPVAAYVASLCQLQ